MGSFYYVIAVVLTLSQFLCKSTNVSASELNNDAIMWNIHSSFRQSQGSDSTKPQVNENRDLRPLQGWPQSCLQVSSNQTVDNTRKVYIAALNRSLSEQFDEKQFVHSTDERTSRFRIWDGSVRNREKREAAKEEKNKMKKRILFATVVRRQRHSRGVVIRFILTGADIRKLTSVQLLAYNVCKRTAAKPVLIIKLHNEKRRKGRKCGKRTTNLHHYHNNRRLDDSIKRNIQYKGWLTFNITTPVQALWKNMKRACKTLRRNKLSLIIKSSKCISPTAHKTADGRKWKPFLEIVTPSNEAKVQRKNSAPLECTPGEKRCCLQRSNVSLKELGDWTSQILVPKVFSGGYCRGSCFERSSTRRSYLGISQPCCVPTKTSALSAVYLDAGSLSIKNLPDVLVHECGCV